MSRKIAKEHIKEYFAFMRKRMHQDTDLANTLVKHIRRIAMSQRLPLDKEVKRMFCKHCYHIMIPGKTCRVRLQGKKIVYYCNHCGNYTRIPYHKKKSKKT